jgi:hypothetical protein
MTFPAFRRCSGMTVPPPTKSFIHLIYTLVAIPCQISSAHAYVQNSSSWIYWEIALNENSTRGAGGIRKPPERRSLFRSHRQRLWFPAT